MDNVIGERIRISRTKRNLTQRDLGEKIGISLHTIMRWEKGKSAPNVYELIDLARVLEVSTAYLLGESENQGKPTTESAEDLDQIMRNLASENPDIVIRFRDMRLQWPELTKDEKRVILDGLLYVLGKANVDLEARLRKEGKKGNV